MSEIKTYNGNSLVKADGVEHQFTQEEIAEYVKCAKDPVYFVEKYVKIVHIDKGLVPMKLWDFQKEMLNQFHNNRFNIAKLSRQVGKSTVTCAYCLHYAIFNPEKTVAILANKGATAREMLGRMTKMLENLPFFLQPGTRVLNKGSVEFSNGSSIIAASTSSSSIRGLSIALLVLDEFAFVQNSEEFYTSTYPVISSGKESKVIITSTPNGINNMFFKLWRAAVHGESDYKPFTVLWDCVPGRDEEWKRETIRNTSEQQFKQEYLCEFIGSTSTLIDTKTLLGLKSATPVTEVWDTKIYEKPIQGHNYVLVADVAKGRGQDYSTFSIFDVSVMPFKQVAVYRDNNVSPLRFPDYITRLATSYNKAVVVVENNDAGIVVCNELHYNIEYENMYNTSQTKSNGIGVTMTSKVKRVGCSNFKDMLEQGKMEIVDAQTITEISAFGPKKDSFAGLNGEHDDLVMNLVLFSWFAGEEAFADLADIDSLVDLIYTNRSDENSEPDELSFGFINDGVKTLDDDIEPGWKEVELPWGHEMRI